MTCTLCRGVERWLSRIDPIFAEEGTKFWAEVRKGGNTDSLFFADPDPQRLRELVALAKTAPERAFADFLVGAQAQEAIRTFGADRYGAPLFYPDAGKKDD